ncbi:MAG: trans-2-enoyl-CoA reductase family protein [Gammaproteobacteria bacterium]|nr:trans-2-enoyl-CoA reductase family protein [Gammaproteobacteria bacterium]
MIIEPKVRGFICTAAHPQGCYEAVKQQIDYVTKTGQFNGPKNVLVIGASTGYGLATRISAAFGAKAKTIGVFYERPAAGKRTASAGWYNTAAFEALAHKAGLYAKSINGDAFSDAIKAQTLDLIREDLEQIDLVVYSLAAPRRTDPKTGQTYQSVLKPVDEAFTNKTVDPMTGQVKEVSLTPASDEDIANTVAVMGGEDWELWMDLLSEQDLLSEGAVSLAYTYIGPQITHAIYKDGTIGKAKEHLHDTAEKINHKLKQKINGRALISVNKALVTQASSAIPVVPLYISILFKLMKQQGTDEGCIEQIYRLLTEHIYTSNPPPLDEAGRIRIDDLEMDPEIQRKIIEVWPKVTSENIDSLTDIASYRENFYRLFGFKFDDIDYSADVDPNVNIESIKD